MDNESWMVMPEPRNNIAEELEKYLTKAGNPNEQVLMSFIGDPYSETKDNNKATRDCLGILLRYKVPIAILTKGGERCLKDIDLFKKFGNHIQIGATLTFDNDADSKEWEPGAAMPKERINALRTLHGNGIKTFVSFEPVINPEQSLHLMEMSNEYVDVFKVGKINHNKAIEQSIDWTDFLQKTVNYLRKINKPFYIKHDLRIAAPSVKLYGNEVLQDEFNVK